MQQHPSNYRPPRHSHARPAMGKPSSTAAAVPLFVGLLAICCAIAFMCIGIAVLAGRWLFQMVL